MKASNLVSALRSSTKATLVACSVFLTLTALPLFVLMVFPIKIKEQQTALSATVQIATTTATASTTNTTEAAGIAVTTQETSHTLSTWAVAVDTMTTTAATTTETSSDNDENQENSNETILYEEGNIIYDENGSTYRPDSDWLQENYGYTTSEQTITETVMVEITSEQIFDSDGEEIVAAEPVAPNAN